MKRLASFFGSYWVRVIFIALAGVYLGARLDESDNLLDVRYRVSEFLQGLSPRGEDAQRTTLVLITDEEYWKGELQGRSPIRRDYIARIVTAAAEANAAVIALDFDFRSPSPDGDPFEAPEYQQETELLVDAIHNAISDQRQIVLTKTIGQDSQGAFLVESDVYGLEVPRWKNVRVGYHVLPDDVRNLSLALNMSNGGSLDSFALAIARADNAPSLKRISDLSSTYYSGFLEPNSFPAVTSSELLNGSKTNLIQNRVVIVSGAWHQDGYKRGPTVRSWPTPVGDLPGVFIHANYFEALFDKRFYRLWEGWSMKGTEFLLALVVAIPFHISFRSKWRTIAMVVAPYMLIVVASYLLLIAFGWFFDPSIPLLAVAAHGILERILQWRSRAKAAKKSLSTA